MLRRKNEWRLIESERKARAFLSRCKQVSVSRSFFFSSLREAAKKRRKRDNIHRRLYKTYLSGPNGV